MKKGIHPEYIPCKVTCACGNSFEIYTNTDTLRIELCDKCHPFYTGKKIFVDTAGRVEKFYQKYKAKDAVKLTPKEKVEVKKEEPEKPQRRRRRINEELIKELRRGPIKKERSKKEEKEEEKDEKVDEEEIEEEEEEEETMNHDMGNMSHEEHMKLMGH